MDIWHTGGLTGTGDGWIGRYVDAKCCGYGKGESCRPDGSMDGKGEPPIAIGNDSLLMLSGRSMMPVSFESADLFAWAGKKYSEDIVEEHHKLKDMINQRVEQEKDSNNAFLLRSAMDARVSSNTIRRAVHS